MWGVDCILITITQIARTCNACPSQWEGYDAEGNYYYFRYRGGHLRVDAIPNQEDWVSPIQERFGGERSSEQQTIFSEQIGDGFDGFMTLEKLCGHVSNIMNILPRED